MAGSQDFQVHRRIYRPGKPAPRTPGSLGINDHADPCVNSHIGDSPGPVGVNDHAAIVAGGVESAALKRATELKLMLLSTTRVAAFLNSVLYLTITAEMAKSNSERMGLVFHTASVDLGDEKVKDQKVKELHGQYMMEFTEAASKGPDSALKFLIEADRARNEARKHIEEVTHEAVDSSEKTTKHLGTTVKVLKTVEYTAGAALTVMGLFVGAAGALTAGVIGFGYDTVTDALDEFREKGRVNADAVAMVSENTSKNSFVAAGKEFAKGKLAGIDESAVEKLEDAVKYYAEKIAVKEKMIEHTKSLRNVNKLKRAMAKDESALLAAEKGIKRFKGVAFIFAAWDVSDKAMKIWKAWQEDE